MNEDRITEIKKQILALSMANPTKCCCGNLICSDLETRHKKDKEYRDACDIKIIELQKELKKLEKEESMWMLVLNKIWNNGELDVK